ncbi:hypothetical protein EJ06DRAFT_65643 [Trichodelitschia bisporula]|uniref:Uncharacterized protein n=1 Tax=Trichodelitschia bisporula TaxID=703511 RepID=A0A6G1HSI2_9PEZI|nr:hypothetical protein EJ06DRAFT_65643 [Trichodelitschia bisporula]
MQADFQGKALKPATLVKNELRATRPKDLTGAQPTLDILSMGASRPRRSNRCMPILAIPMTRTQDERRNVKGYSRKSRTPTPQNQPTRWITTPQVALDPNTHRWPNRALGPSAGMTCDAMILSDAMIPSNVKVYQCHDVPHQKEPRNLSLRAV